MSDAPDGAEQPAEQRASDERRGFRGFVTAILGRPLGAGFALTLGGIFAIGLAIAFVNLSSVLISIGLAMFVALAMAPTVAALQRRKVRRGWAITIVCGGLVLGFALILWLLIPSIVSQFAELLQGIPAAFAAFPQSDLYAWLFSVFGDAVKDAAAAIHAFITDPKTIAAITGGVLSVGGAVVSGISTLILIFVLTLYFLGSLEPAKRAFYQLAPAHSRPKLSDLTERITGSIGAFLRGMVILSGCNAVILFLLFLVLGIPFAALFAVLAFFVTMIPLVGTVVMWIIATVFALFASPLSALIFGLAYLVYMQLEAYLLTPRVMNKAIAVPGAFVLIGAMVGGTLFGLLGALVAVPVTASILLIIKEIVVPRQDAKV